MSDTDAWLVDLREQQLRDLRTQLAAANARAEAAESALRLATHSTGSTTVLMTLEQYQELLAAVQRAEAAEAKLLALQVDRSKTVKLRDDTDNVIWALKPEDVPGAINWGDLGCREVQEVINDERRWYRVIIEEADPNNPALHDAVLIGLTALGWVVDDLEIEMAW